MSDSPDHPEEPAPETQTARSGSVPGKWLAAGLSALVLFVGIAVGVMQINTGAPTAADAPATEFSAERAVVLTQRLVGDGEPHGIGSADHARVKDELLAMIRESGFEPEVERNNLTTQWVSDTKGVDVYADTFKSPVATTDTSNIIVRVPGTSNSSKAVVVSAHYDSVPPGPGASDDAAQVAAMVEVMRALKSAPPLRHDVLFLFTDGEELAMRGSRAFVLKNPAAQDIEFILNFEFRGTTGKALFFEGNYVDSDLIDKYRAATDAPLASSMFFSIYQHLENNTDFSVLSSLDKPGLAFAPIGNNVRYHTPNDDMVNLSPGAIQDSGDVMLSMVRDLADQEVLEARTDEELTWFNVGPFLFSYTTAIAMVILVLAWVIWLAAVLLGVRRGEAGGRGVAGGFGIAVLAGVVAIILAQVILALVYWLRWDTRDFISFTIMNDTDPYRGQLYMVTEVFAVAAVTVALLMWARRRNSVASLQLGALAVLGLMAILMMFFEPPGAYWFYIPFLIMGIAVLVRVLVLASQPWVVLVVDLAASFVVIVFVFPLDSLVYQGLSLSAGAIVAMLVAWNLCILVPLLDHIAQALGKLLPLAAAATALILFVIGVATPLVNANHRQPDSIVYAVNADDGTAGWYSNDAEPDEWTQTVLTAEPESIRAPQFLLAYFRDKQGMDRNVLAQPGQPPARVQPPRLKVQSDRTAGGERTVRFRITSPRQAENLWYTMDTDGTFTGFKVNGEAVTIEPASQWSNVGYGVPDDGYDVELTLTAGSSLEVLVSDQTNEIPDGVGLPPRPDTTMSWWPRGKQADATVVYRTYQLG
ncbi:MAG: M20/M25/M40 family metallo-hydrolase [Actinobacteria bacterium]|nr:M20/M25/M40 family metallo-hydrolase [Actinomycetota bacterium]